MIPSNAASEAQILRVHDREYLQKLKDGTISEKEQRRLGLPWTPQLLTRSLYSVGGTIATARAAVDDGIAMNLAGGTHHAYPDHGEGFCVFNDVAIAIKLLQDEEVVQRIVIIDCDVHQGNGTAFIFQDDPNVFTFSIHGAKNFPLYKEKSDLDIELADGTGDDDYLNELDWGVRRALDLSNAQLAFYLATLIRLRRYVGAAQVEQGGFSSARSSGIESLSHSGDSGCGHYVRRLRSKP